MKELFYMLPNEMELSKYRLERAREDLHTAEINLSNGLYKGAVNRSYYAIFHGIRAVNILDGFDASKHSSVIAHFNQYHVHTGDFEKETYKIIDSAYRIREKSDYSDFFIVSREEAEGQYEKAVMFVKRVEEFIEKLQ
jgi:hypothetical protein